jgi:exonuclease III
VITVNSENDDSAQTYKKVNNRIKTKVHIPKGIPKVNKNIKIFSTNAAGLLSKGESLVNEIHATSANIVTVQETHCTSKGRIKMHTSFVIFEAIRKAKHGGTMCAIHEDFSPKLIEEYDDPFELLVVEIETKVNSVRLITGCGPQENWDEGKRVSFFIALESEIVKAEIAGTSIIIEMDANAKLGKKYIPNDSHDKSPNGRLLANIIDRHALVVANGSEKCTGRITRKRITKDRIEESAIDVVIFSNDLKDQFKSLRIDEDRKHVLTKIRKTKKGTIRKESDHNVLVTEFEMAHDANTNKKVELYNLKNAECQSIFKKYTSNTRMLSSVFDANEDLNILTD